MADDSVYVIINGSLFDGWVSVDVDLKFDAASNEATVVITERPRDPFPVRLNDTAQVIIGGEP